MASIKIIEGHNVLNAVGCSFFIESNEKVMTRISSSDLRWLSIREGNGAFLSDEQKTACDRIDEIIERFGSSVWDKMNMRILLFSNPIRSKNEYILKLIRCGADVRYCPVGSKTRMALRGNRLYLSHSSDCLKVVNTGWLYEGRAVNDPFIDYYRNWFDSKFASSRKIIVRGDKMRYDESIASRILKSLKNMSVESWLNIVLGAVMGAIISCLVALA